VKFLTGGDEAKRFLVRDPFNLWLNGGSGETPGPTVKVWMGEGKKTEGFVKGRNMPISNLYFLLSFLKTLKNSFSLGSFLFN